MKASDVIELAKNDPRYISDERWLCAILYQLEGEGAITYDQMYLAKDEIGYAIRPTAFLRNHLIYDGIINRDTEYVSPEYHVAAHAFWDNLIAELRAKGQ